MHLEVFCSQSIFCLLEFPVYILKNVEREQYCVGRFKLYLVDFTVDIYYTCIRHIYVTGFDGKHYGLFESSWKQRA